MSDINSKYVTDDDGDYGEIPDDLSIYNADIDLVTNRVEKVPAKSERIRYQRDNFLARN